MAWDYKNPGIPKRGDGRYQNKFPETYQILDCLREHYYDSFKSDLSFNGNKNQMHYGCPETYIYATEHTCKNFAGIQNKKSVFTLYTEKGTLNEKDNYVEFEMQKEIFETEYNKQVLEFMKKAITEITTRNFNLALTRDGKIKFIHVPFDRQRRGLEMYSDSDSCYYTKSEFIYFMNRLYDNQYFYMNYVGDTILSTLNETEKKWLKWNNEMPINSPYYHDWDEERKIEIGPKLEYVRIRKQG